ncbi:Ctr copper transporter [Dendrothele bispora CBS 962.96]|uniref:Copper transport protein n=1 Tax=Dendrothele bispora (strain CBS 962.96) TaxID=1314807 RepID=A0A4S8LA92_DENBC|nr:Ctr copper transporter [Dendrothele bispora CBS 962.96]
MDHGDHGGHGGHDMPMGPSCSMNMLWNTQIVDTCIVFPSWHIRSNADFVLSFFIIIALGVFYEYLRVIQKNVDQRIASSLTKGKRRERNARSRSISPTEQVEAQGLLSGGVKPAGSVPVPPFYRVVRAVLYGLTVFLSFFLMLVFMTYNAYLILAVVVGAAIGHYIFGGSISPFEDAKGMACH